MKILLSIRAKYALRIFDGTKKWEYRRVLWKKNVDTVCVYAGTPIKKIIGEFQVEYIVEDTPKSLWIKTWSEGGIDVDSFRKYFKWKEKGYAIRVSKPVLYREPLPLGEFGLNRPPQFFTYL